MMTAFNAAATLPQSAAPLADIIDSLPGHAAILDHRGTILAVNAGWRRYADANGYRGSGHGIGTSYLDACGCAQPNPTRYAREAQRVIEAVLSGALSSGSFDYPCHAPDRKQWFRMMVSPWQGAAAPQALVLHYDVTEECEARIALAQTLRNLRLAGGGARALAGIIHDAKSPIGAVAGLAQVLRLGLAGPTTEKQIEYLDDILNACAQAQSVIDGEVRRLFFEAPEAVAARVEVGETIERVAGMLVSEAEQAGMTIATEVAPELPPLAVPAPVLARIIGNLVTNAIRHAGAGARISIAAGLHGADLVISVADDGIGVPEAELRDLTLPLRRGTQARSAGSGLGLSVVRDLAANFGATCAVASEPGRGFRVTLSFGEEAQLPRAARAGAA